MTVYICKVFDGKLGEWVVIGVFSNCAKAMENGTRYIMSVCDTVEMLDWEYTEDVYIDWYNSQDYGFTREITKCQINKALA